MSDIGGSKSANIRKSLLEKTAMSDIGGSESALDIGVYGLNSLVIHYWHGRFCQLIQNHSVDDMFDFQKSAEIDIGGCCFKENDDIEGCYSSPSFKL